MSFFYLEVRNQDIPEIKEYVKANSMLLHPRRFRHLDATTILGPPQGDLATIPCRGPI
jgi:hypothetical protein